MLSTSLGERASMASMDAEHGPFHRLRNATTQSDDVADSQQRSQEIWGLAARWSNLRAVKAYCGLLPDGAEGIEFMTAVPPTRHGPYNVLLRGVFGRLGQS